MSSSTSISSNSTASKARPHHTHSKVMSSQTTPKSKAYKELLTTSLHRRFTNASYLVLAVCLLEATLLSNDSIIWAWFPFGYNGLRTLLLFLPCLFVFIIRVYNLHFGARTTISGVHTLSQSLTSVQLLVTFGWYFAAAQLFGEIYIWTKAKDGNLGWVDQGRAYERARLNENPIVLRCLYGVMAVIQTGTHLYHDIDRVELAKHETPPSESKIDPTLQKLTAHAIPLAKDAFHLTLTGIIGTLITYYAILRNLMWSPTYAIAKFFDHELPRHAVPTGVARPNLLVWQACTSAFLLAVLWGASNTIFTVFMAQPPLKKTQPLTSDTSTNNGVLVSKAVDANGSLINGITRKKETPRTFALWELCLVCTQFVERRRSIFLEVDRVGGSSWMQISRQCLTEIEAISSRIQKHQSTTIAAENRPQAQQSGTPQPVGLPRIASQQARQDDILRKTPPDFTQSLATMAKSAGQHPGAGNPVSPFTKSTEKALAWSSRRVLTPAAQQQMTKENLEQQASGKLLQALQSPLGEPFRETFARTATAVVLGTPYSAQTNIVHATRSLAVLLKASTEEDKFGVVAKDVPLVVRTLLASIRSIQQFLEILKPSWTDVDFEPRQKQVPEIMEVVGVLQKALEEILLAFGEYATSLGMSRKELREAKEAVGMSTNQEMIHVR